MIARVIHDEKEAPEVSNKTKRISRGRGSATSAKNALQRLQILKKYDKEKTQIRDLGGDGLIFTSEKTHLPQSEVILEGSNAPLRPPPSTSLNDKSKGRRTK